MRKSTLFISAVLTTFVLAMLAGVASAYQNFAQTDQVAQAEPAEQEVQAQSQVQTVAQNQPASEEVSADLTPKDAIDLAEEVMGDDDLYSIEMTELNGESVYLVTFTSGDLVYISLDGQIRSVDHIEVQTVVVNVSSSGRARDRNDSSVSNKSSSNSGGERESHEDDHEDHQEYDD